MQGLSGRRALKEGGKREGPAGWNALLQCAPSLTCSFCAFCRCSMASRPPFLAATLSASICTSRGQRVRGRLHERVPHTEPAGAFQDPISS